MDFTVFIFLIGISFAHSCDVFIRKSGVRVVAAEYESSCLNFVPDEADWYGAAHECRKGGGVLASVYDNNMQQFLIKTVKRNPALIDWNFWVGVYQRKPKEHGGFQWAGNPLNCDAHPKLPRHECSVLPFHRLNKTECLNHYCCFLETNSPQCFYSPVKAEPLYYEEWTRDVRAQPHRLCGSLSKAANYNWADMSCKSAYRQGYICQYSPPVTSRRLSIDWWPWIIFIIGLTLFILALILFCCCCCYIRRRLKRRPWWRRDSDTKLVQNGSNSYYPHTNF